MNSNKNYEEHLSCSWSEESVRLILTPSSLAKSIYFYVQEAGYFMTSDTYFTERKNLNSFLIVYTISGKGTLKYYNNTYSLKKGQCFFINCMDHHYYETCKNEQWEFLWFHFSGPNSLGYYEEFIRNGFKIVTVHDSDYVERGMKQIISINQKRNFSTEIQTCSLITDLLTRLLIQTMTEDTSNIQIPEYLKKVMKHIDKNFYTPLSLDGLAQSHGVSKFHLSREFKRYTGTTVNEYIIASRLSYAKELLKYSNFSVNEIALQTGMNNISHFINLFKARENMTPLAYRKEWTSVT